MDSFKILESLTHFYFYLAGNKCYKVVTAIEADPVNVGATFEEALESCNNLTDGLFPTLASISNEEENGKY